jgi:hypothetical protein
MKRTLAMMCMTLACSAGVSVFAQATRPQTDQKPMTAEAAMTVSGCVAAGMEGKGYMLNNATTVHKTDMATVKPGDKATMKPSATGGPTMSYALAGADVAGHVGHKVELTGTLSKADMDRLSKMETMDQAARDKMMADLKMKAMTFTVTAVKMVSATCP